MNYVELISSTFRNIRHGVTPTSPRTCLLFVVGRWIFFNGCADAPKKPKTHPTLPILPYPPTKIPATPQPKPYNLKPAKT